MHLSEPIWCPRQVSDANGVCGQKLLEWLNSIRAYSTPSRDQFSLNPSPLIILTLELKVKLVRTKNIHAQSWVRKMIQPGFRRKQVGCRSAKVLKYYFCYVFFCSSHKQKFAKELLTVAFSCLAAAILRSYRVAFGNLVPLDFSSCSSIDRMLSIDRVRWWIDMFAYGRWLERVHSI